MTNGKGNMMIRGEMCVWLQGVGYHVAKLTGELKPGDVMVWNTGETSTVGAIEIKGKTAHITEIYDGGKTYIRKRRVTTYTAIVVKKAAVNS